MNTYNEEVEIRRFRGTVLSEHVAIHGMRLYSVSDDFLLRCFNVGQSNVIVDEICEAFCMREADVRRHLLEGWAPRIEDEIISLETN